MHLATHNNNKYQITIAMVTREKYKESGTHSNNTAQKYLVREYFKNIKAT